MHRTTSTSPYRITGQLGDIHRTHREIVCRDRELDAIRSSITALPGTLVAMEPAIWPKIASAGQVSPWSHLTETPTCCASNPYRGFTTRSASDSVRLCSFWHRRQLRIATIPWSLRTKSISRGHYRGRHGLFPSHTTCGANSLRKDYISGLTTMLTIGRDFD
jgi:hypothetical protein